MGVVGEMHAAIGAVPVVTDLVYRALRGVTGLVGVGVDNAVKALAPLLGDSEPGPQREAVLAALNGVVGDHLEATKNPLAIQMALRPPLESLHRGGTLLLLVHGSSMNDLQWTRNGHDHGRCLARDLGFTPAYAHYNSGRHVSTNGKELATLLETESVGFDRIVVVAHSMGGLVARAAIRYAEIAALVWRPKLTALVTLGTPHHGAPLEKGGNIAELILGVTKYSAPLRTLAQIRSAGVTDLRFGNVVDEDWHDRDRFAIGFDPRVSTPLPKGVRCYAVAGTNTRVSETGAPIHESAFASDNLVSVASALGKHDDPARCLQFTDSLVVMGANHLDLLSRSDVYEMLRKWLNEHELPRPIFTEDVVS
jgi:pimeloyl-ACP methyl ester carboxylesterase